jgi:hypothetical protein
MGSRHVLLAFALALGLSATSALAPPPALAAPAAPTAAQRETARRLMDEGKSLTRKGDLAGALDAYKKAHAIMHVPTTGYAVAKTQLALGHLVEARDVALQVVRMPHETAREPAAFEQARKRSRELEASLKPRIPSLEIVVKGGPAAKVTIDDVDVAQLLLGEPIAVNPGDHVVVAKNADGVEDRAAATLAERESKQVVLTLPEPKPVTVAAPAPEPKAPEAPADSAAAEPGRAPRTTAASVLVFGGFGLAAAGAVAGSVAGVLALSKAGDVEPQCERDVCDPAAKTDLDRARTMATISTIGYAVAGAGAIAGVIGLILPRSRVDERAAARIEPRASVLVGPAGLAVRGTF